MFKVGDPVEWTSHGGKFLKTKRGVVVAVVPAGARPHGLDFIKYIALDGVGLPRKTESYVVAVTPSGKGRPQLYWPFVSKLTGPQETTQVPPVPEQQTTTP